jgi:hypothetical protein
VETICKDSKIYLAGGSIIEADSLGESIKEALDSIADRQFNEFKNKADYKDWDKALNQALGKNPDALKRIGYTGEPKDHPIALEILRFIGNSSKQGKEVRAHFMKTPYGWSQDAIDTILLMLKITEHLSCSEPDLKVVNMNVAVFKKEIHILSASEKLKLRKLYADAHCGGKPNEEFIDSNKLLSSLKTLAETISGDAPLPEPINTKFLKEIENLDGNERLLRILEEQEDLRNKLADWTEKAELTSSRLPHWNIMVGLSQYLPVQNDFLREEYQAIREDRLLYNEPDLVLPLLNRISDALNDVLKEAKAKYNDRFDLQMKSLQEDVYFSKLTPEQKHIILAKNQLLMKPEIKHADAQALLFQIQKTSLDMWQTKVAALSGQFQSALEEAIALSAPKAELYSLPKQTLNSEAEIDDYVEDLRKELKELIKKAGSVILK